MCLATDYTEQFSWRIMEYVTSNELACVCANQNNFHFCHFIQCSFFFAIVLLCVCAYIIIISGIHYMIVMVFSKWIVEIDVTHWIGEREALNSLFHLLPHHGFVCVNHFVGASNSITQFHCYARWKALMQIFTQFHHILHPHKAFIFSVCLHFSFSLPS